MTARPLPFLLLAALLLAPPAQANPPDPLLRIGGRTGGPSCSAVLVASRSALTAAHCARRGHVKLYAGWQGGRAAAMRRAEIAGRPRLAPRAANLYHLDQALLKLARPFDGLVPARPGPAPAKGSTVHVHSFPGRATEAHRDSCTVLDRAGTEILLDCPATAGMSGAPIFQNGRVVGLLTSRIGRDRSLGTVIAADLLE